MTLYERVRRMEDVAAITQLTYRYAQAVNTCPEHGLDLAAIPQLFTADARWSSDDLGTTVGAAAIATELPIATATIQFSAHAFLNPIIEVDGDHAAGSWLLWIVSVHDHRPAAVFLRAGLNYLRTDTVWRIDAMHIGAGVRIPVG